MSLMTARLTQLVEAQAAAGGGNVTVTPSTASLALTALAPRIGSGVIPGTLALTLTALAPRIGTGVVPAAAVALSLTTFAPAVTATANVTVTPPAASLLLTTFAPTVTTDASVTVTPATAVLTTQGFVPVLKEALTPSAASLALTALAPRIGSGVAPAAASLALTTYAPAVSATGNITVTPSPASLTLTTYAPVVTGAEEAEAGPAPSSPGPAITPRGRAALLNPPGVPWQPLRLRLPQTRALTPDGAAYAAAWAATAAAVPPSPVLAAARPLSANASVAARGWVSGAGIEAAASMSARRRLAVEDTLELQPDAIWRRLAAEQAQLRRRVREVEERAVLGLDRLPDRTIR